VSIAETLADQEHLRYCNIEMSPQLRELGIPLLFTVDVPGSEISAEQTAKWNALRESHMLHELLDAISGARAMIVICGVIHMPAIIQALRTKVHPRRAVRRYDVGLVRRDVMVKSRRLDRLGAAVAYRDL
jgi:hypothetical protein